MSAGEPPSGVVTFLFTDIEGSTRRWEADAVAMRAALSKHDQVLQTAIESHDGFVFSHTGDGVVAAFASPMSAVDAAVKAQLALQLPVRMGLATGEAERRDGDYFGTVLNRAARVMAAGHGGQILVADSTAGLLSGVALIDLGPRRLRDVPMPIGLFQVRAEGLRTEFAPLRALDTTPGNLRPATTSLIGRESEITHIEAAVRSHRLVTLTGVGGVGKTRLALEVAAQLTDEFPDGVWVFELAAATDPATVPDTVAAVLGITQQPGQTVSESLAAALEGRIRLLVIDNCEHVLDAAADLVEAILAQSGAVKVLATSREVLGVAEETVWPVRSLDVAGGVNSAGVSLFVERAQGISPGFSIDGGEAAAVTEICQRLDGIPLAIELAASRMASMTATEMRDRLDHRFRLLVGSRRGLERHQTLRHAVAWSYDLLDGAERRVLERCSVFVGGFGLESACAVAGFDDRDEYVVFDILDALVRKSLLVADRSSGRTRFTMLETIRQFAEEQLVASGAASEARTAHSHYFAGRESEIFAVWNSPRQRESFDWLATELANLRAAFRWASDQRDLDSAAAIAMQAGMLGVMVENYEPITWAEELIKPAREANHPRLASLCSIASLCYMVGRVDDALEFSEAGHTAMRSGAQDVPFGLEAWLCAVYGAIGEPDRWIAVHQSQLESGRNTYELTRSCLVSALTVAGRDEEALELAAGLIEAAEATHNPYAFSFALLACGFAYRERDPLRAFNALQKGLVIAQQSGNRANETYLALALAQVASTLGDPLAALDKISLAISNYHDAGNTTQGRAALATLATLLDRLERYEQAATIAGFTSVGPTPRMPEFDAAITHLRERLGDPTYERLAHKGEMMTTAEMVTYAYEQIDQAQTELKAVSE
ncbi:ATP-binding protein [Mycolicibacterium moriokaense]|uniref:Putative ATPase n=1 Tax=Mycolicibacterium moriokaense TaxID=39691 RepID=A0A318H596_9MYCO|nr:adenylate/guanylate cyclase domain-containing protein [Mycolicibacterium moriokaense]PXW99137.1 putative ATPase [Mycolicibacterium moriokaense]